MNDTKNELEIIELTQENIESMIYTIRGHRVMLDADLAKIYGYSTKAFNQQVQRNIEKFPEDFMFALTDEEVDAILQCKNVTANSSGNLRSKILTAKEESELDSSRCQNVTMNTANSSRSQNVTMNKSGNMRGFNVKYNPYAFTEQGIYMLMTVLKGELAIKQSKALIRLFKKMKDYIRENDLNVALINQKFESYDNRLGVVEAKLDVVMDNFVDPSKYRHFLIMNGERLEADIAYQSIYKLAKRSIYIIDDYIGVKTLHLLLSAKSGVDILIVSDNVSREPLKEEYIEDFLKESGNNITIIPSKNTFHDRYIIVDYFSNEEKIFLCGSSSKDTGGRVTTIMEIEHRELYHPLIDELLKRRDH